MTTVADGKIPMFLQTEHAFVNKLLKGKFYGGQQLKESLLAQEFGVSRPIMREVLCQAVGWGVVEYVAFSGFRIKDFTIRELFDWYDMRLAVEPLAARRIVEAGDPEAIQKISSCHEREHAAIKAADRIAFAAANLDFHRTILTVTGNSRFSNPAMLSLFAVIFNFEREVVNEVGYFSSFKEKMPSSNYMTPFLREQNQSTFRHSGKIVAALNSGSPERAERVVHRYVEGVINDRKRNYSFFGDWDEPFSLLLDRCRQMYNVNGKKRRRRGKTMDTGVFPANSILTR